MTFYPGSTTYPGSTLFPGESAGMVVDSPTSASAGDPGGTLAVGVTRVDTAGSGGSGNPPSARLIDQAALPSSGELAVLWWAIHPTTGARIALPDVASWTLSPILGSPGALSLNYPSTGLNFDTLDGFVTERRDLEVEVWFRGRVQGALRGVLCEKSGDLVEAGAVWSFGGHFLEHLMSQILVTPYAPHPKRETVFSAVSPGTVMATLMQRAHARGTATDITFATFTAAVDSNGVAWNRTVTATLSPVNTTYLQVLDDLVEQGACEWEITPAHQLRLYVPGTRGTDRTVGANPVVLRRGRNLTEVPSKVSSREGGTDLWGIGGEGLYHLEFDATARATRGRQVERAFSANGVNDAGALDALTTARLPAVTGGVREVTHGILFGADDPLPLSGFDIGDWVYSNPGKGSTGAGGGNERLRLRQWSLSRDAARKYTGTITLNDLLAEQLVQLQRRLAALQGGRLVVGTSTPGSSGPDTLAPAAPAGLVASSSAYQVAATAETQAAVTVSWSAVITNSDGTAASDIAGYRVQYGLQGVAGGPFYREATPSEGISATTFTFGEVTAGIGIWLRVAAFDQSGNQSAWSTAIGHTTANDNTPPPVPSTPTARNFLRQLIVEWNGLGSAGEVMPVDFDYVEVHFSTATNFTVTTATLFERMYAKGGVVYDPGSYSGAVFFKLVSVDLAGNKSVASAQASATPSRAIADDIGDQIISSAKLADGAVLGPKIAAEAVSTPHLSVATFSDNMLPNGGFEDVALTGTSPASWAVGTNTGGTNTFTRDTVAANVRSGGASAKLEMSAASGTFDIRSEVIPTKPGDNWYFELSAKASRAVNGLHVTLIVGDTDPPTTAFPTLLANGALTTSFPAEPLGFNYTVPAAVGAGVTPKYLRLLVRTGIVTGDAAALDVWVDEVRARKVVGTAEIQDAAISRAKIGLLAVGDGQFESASVGKLTAGTLSVAVTNAGIIRTATSGQRTEQDPAGFRMYNTAGTQTVGLTGVSNFITGELRTALTGTRAVWNPGGTNPDRIDFFPSSGTIKAYLQTRTFNSQALIDLVGGSTRGDLASGQCGAHPNEGYIRWGLPESINPYSFAVARVGTIEITGPQVDFTVENRYASSANDGIRKFTWASRDSSGVGISGTLFWLRFGGTSQPWLAAVDRNCGVLFDQNSVSIVNGAGSFGPVAASAFNVNSSVGDKTDIGEIDAVIGALDPIDVLDSTPSKSYRYTRDLIPRPPKTPAGDDWQIPAPVVPWHFGPMAEDLPAAMVTVDEQGRKYVNIDTKVGLLWEAVRRLSRRVRARGVVVDGRLDSIAARVAILEAKP